MRIIIDNKLYDTESAEKLLTLTEPMHFGDYEETLYRKKNGEFFLHSADSLKPDPYYANYYTSALPDNLQCYPEERLKNFLPLKKSFALEWVERNFSVDEYIKIFGEPKE